MNKQYENMVSESTYLTDYQVNKIQSGYNY